MALPTLRARSRDLVRNNPYAAAAVREIPTNTVGAGIIPQARAQNEAQTARAEALVKAWFDTKACDASGRHNFYGLQNLVFRSVVESGEALIVRRILPRTRGNVLPLQIQVLEADHLDTSKDGMTNGDNLIIQGVEFTPAGAVAAYWLFPQHPGDYSAFRQGLVSERFPASDVIHVYRVDRPGQVRGVPWAAPVLLRMRDFDDYEDAQLLRQKIAACYAAFIYNPDPLAAGDGDSSVLPDRLEPGLLEELPGGRRIEFAQPPGVEGYSEYSTVSLHSISTGFGVPYSVLTGDLRQVNFSSGRMGWLNFQRNIKQWTQNILIEQMCMGVWEWFAQAAEIQGNTGPLNVTWSPPRREMIDPAREVPALRDAVRAGQITLQEAIRQQGYDPDEFFREIQEGNALLDQYGIVLDSDPRRVNGSGMSQPRDRVGGTNDEE